MKGAEINTVMASFCDGLSRIALHDHHQTRACGQTNPFKILALIALIQPVFTDSLPPDRSRWFRGHRKESNLCHAKQSHARLTLLSSKSKPDKLSLTLSTTHRRSCLRDMANAFLFFLLREQQEGRTLSLQNSEVIRLIESNGSFEIFFKP